MSRNVVARGIVCGFLLLAVMLQGCATSRESVEVQGASREIIKSPNDDREYRHIVLENGLDVLLISDPDAEKAAAALDVYVGNYQSPEGREGLPHFLEHMLFLGTKKYPDPAAYDEFIDQHGGSKNAYTSHENTNYFFQIDAGHLEPASDRFAQFFTAPLFNAEYVNREVSAVESEYQLHIKDDPWRHRYVLREQVNPDHPFSKFMVGSLDTLADQPKGSIRNDLIEFYKKYYSANLMKLVVLGKDSLDELQAMVEPRFGSIANHKTKIKPHAPRLVDGSRLPLEITYIPVQEVRELSLIFQVPKQLSSWEAKPAQYIGALVGHEGEGSLLALLKEKGWVEGVGAGMAREDRAGAQFQIDIALTPKGLAARDEIIATTFAWIDLIREKGVENWRYEERARLSDMAFRFKEKRGAMGYVSALASSMHRYSVPDVLRAHYVMSQYDRQLIEQFTNYLVPENLILMITDPAAETDRVSKYYGARYASRTLPRKDYQAWKEYGEVKGLELPQRNPYIPENLEIKENSTTQQVPAELSEGVEGVEAWFLQDSRFGVPRANIIARLKSPRVASVEERTLADLYVEYVKDQLNSQAYPAQEAGLSYSLSANSKGLGVIIGGYSDKQEVLLQAVIDALAKPEWDKGRFVRVKEVMSRNLKNYAREYPFRQLLSGMGSMLKGEWTPAQKVQALEPITIDQLKAFSTGLLSEISLSVVVVGNHTEKDAEAIVSRLGSVISPVNVMPVLRIASLKQGEETEGSFFIEHPDSALLLYVQGRDDSLEERARMLLLGEILSSPFYQSLRTEKQLGYVVAAFTNNQNRVPGLTFLTQSPVLDEEGLKKEFNEFIAGYQKQIADMTEKDLERYRDSVLSRLQERPKNLTELSARFVESLTLGFRDFSFREALVESVSKVSLYDLQSSYSEVLLGERRVLWLKSTDDIDGIQAEDLRGSNSDYEYIF